MAMDEALLQLASRPVVRFYRWAAPAVTFGYAQKYSEVFARAGGSPLVRRWTGGGTVFHGKDLTMALFVPAAHELCLLQIGEIYRLVHQSLLGVVNDLLPGSRLAGCEDCRPGLACFESPALNDILHEGKKICGGALRRGKYGFLYQGSLHGPFRPSLVAGALSPILDPFEPTGQFVQLAHTLAEDKYGRQAWNQMR
jgi:lipoate-protein ligase A